MDIATLLKSGAGNPWLLFPSAGGLGAIHARERWADSLQVISMVIFLLLCLYLIGSAITAPRGLP